MFCVHCGTQIDDAARFCSRCGSAATPAPAYARQPNAMPQYSQQGYGTAPQRPIMVQVYKNPGVALLLSIIFPGGGQFYNGHIGKGFLVLLTFWLVIPYLWSWFDAYHCADRINRAGF